MAAGKYERPPEVEAALAALPSPDDEGYLAVLSTTKTIIEAVVVVHRKTPGGALRDQIADVLAKRSESRVRAAASRHGQALPGEIDDVESELRLRFWKEIQDESFFEVKFNKAMMRLAQTVGRDARRGKRGALERSAARVVPPGSGVRMRSTTLSRTSLTAPITSRRSRTRSSSNKGCPSCRKNRRGLSPCTT